VNKRLKRSGLHEIMKNLLSTIILCGMANMAIAQNVIETWKCENTLSSDIAGVVVKALVFDGRESGRIEVAGVSHTTIFRIDGFYRRWDFGFSGTSYNFAFIISPDGRGRYLDFEGEKNVKPSFFLKCRETR